MSNSSGDWAVEATPAERVAQLQSDVKRLNEENERLRQALRGIANVSTLALEGKKEARRG